MTVMDLLLLVLPDQFLGLLVMVASLGIIIGVVKPRTVMQLIGMILLASISAPFIEVLFTILPWWVGLGVMCIVSIWIVRGVLELLFGREATGHILGAAVIGVVVLTFRVLFLSVRLLLRGMSALASRA